MVRWWAEIGLPHGSWDAIVAAEDALHTKPAPDLFLAAAGKLGIAPTDCVVIEDAIKGIEAAKSAGMRCLAVAQTFLAGQLGALDRVRPAVTSVTLSDLLGQEG